jgi:predicted NBD/HSP70 family sugar kinase
MTLAEIFGNLKDIDITEVVEQYTEMLGTGIVNIVNLFRPQLVLLGGAMSAYADALIPEIRKMMEDDCFGGKYGMIPEIGVAELGDEAGMIGAANL